MARILRDQFVINDPDVDHVIGEEPTESALPDLVWNFEAGDRGFTPSAGQFRSTVGAKRESPGRTVWDVWAKSTGAGQADDSEDDNVEHDQSDEEEPSLPLPNWSD